MAKYVSGRHKNLKVGIASYSENLTSLEVIGNVGIATTNATSKLYVVGDGYFTGVVTALSFSGNTSSATYATSAGIATYATSSGIATYATNAGIATYATSAGIATYATSSGIATYATNAGIATYATSAGIATYATSSGIATYATNAGVSTSVIGGIGSITQLSVSGVSTFSNNIIQTSGSVGLGTTNPLQRLQIGTANTLGINTTGTVFVVTSNADVGIGTTNPIAKLDVRGNVNISGVVTASSFSGNASSATYATSSGIATYATTAGIATYATSAGIATYATNAGVSTYATTAGIATYATSAGIATYATNAGVSTYATTAGIATYANTAGVATALQNARNFSITGNFVTAPTISFNGTGDVALAATITTKSIGLGTYTTGDYVKNISGTANQITVTGGTGEGSTPTLSVPNQFTAPQDVTVTRDLQVNRNLNVTGNITIGGTTAFINVQQLQVADPDLVLGVRTDGSGNDVSNDTTANHGGIAIASTEGSPLVSLYNPGIGESTLATYKKIMWFKSGSFTGLNTDAWLINYAVGIGSTQFPSGTRLAAGAVQFTERDLAVVRNINASGIITGTLANTLTLNTSGTGLSGSTTYNNSGATTFTVTSNATSNNTPSTIVARDASGNFSAGTITANLTGTASTASFATTAFNLSDAANITTGTINSARLSGTYNISISGNAATATYATSSGIATYATTAGIATYATNAGVATVSQGLTGTPDITVGIVTATSYNGSGTNLTGIVTQIIAGTNISIDPVGGTGAVTVNSSAITGVSISTNTTNQSQYLIYSTSTGSTTGFGVSTSGLVFNPSSNNLGIATTNPTSRFYVVGDGFFTGVVTSTSFVGNLTGTATTATNLADAANITTGTINSARLSGTYTININGNATTATYATTAGIATYATSSGIATYATNAGIATYATSSGIATYATTAGIATYATSSGIATYATSSGIATYATSSGIATYATTAGVSTSVIGGVASVTQLSVSGVSTFTNGPVLIGSATSTGTASQPLQVTGDAYVSGNLGIGTTNPTTKLDVSGVIRSGRVDTGNEGGQIELARSTDNATAWYVDVFGNTSTPSFRIVDATAAASRLSIDSAGTVSATKFSGDGSLLTGIAAGITVQDEGSTVGTSVTTLNFSGATVSVSNAVNGISTITVTASGIVTYVDNAGIATNLKGGLTGNIPYQSAPNTTTFLANGSSGTILQSNGVGNAPSWVTAAPAGAITGITVRDEGTIVGSANSVSQLNFVGNIVSVASTAGIATVTFLDYVSNAGVATYASTAGVATALQNSRTFEITGDIVASPISFNGTGNVSLAATIQPNSVALGDDTTGNYVASVTNGSYITGGNGGSEGAALTIGVAATSANTASQVVARDASGNFSAGTITANLTGTASTASFATTSYNLTNAANITTGTINSSRLSGTYNIDISGNAATSTYASTAGVATALQNSRTFEITGDIVSSPISFDGTGNVSLAATIQPNSVALGGDTTGDYVQSISGTSNQITVTGGTGEGSTPTLSVPNQFTAPQDVTVTRDLQVNRNLNVNGNITIGGTSATIFSQTLNIYDPDIVLGYRTDGSGNDVSNDNTANHGGIAIASTEGSPLVQLFIAGIETNPATYKKIMWFKAGTFSGLGTDAWLANYAVGIGSTQFPTGTRLAAGNVQFTQSDLAVVRNINASGIITGTLANTLTLNTSGTGLSGSTTYNNSGAATFTVTSNATSANTASTIVARDASGNFSAGTITANLTGTASLATYATNAGTSTSVIGGIASVTQLSVSGVSTFSSNIIQTSGSVGLGTTNPLQRFQIGTANTLGINTTGTVFVITSNADVGIGTTNPTTKLDVRGNVNISGVVTATTFVGTLSGFASTSGVSTSVIGGIASVTQLSVSGVSTFNNNVYIPSSSVGIGTTNPLQRLQIGTANTLGINTTGTVFVVTSNADVGIGTTNPITKLDVRGNVNISGVVTATTFVGTLSGFASTSGVSTSVIGGIASVTQLSVSGVSTFSNNIIQTSGSVGLGTTNPLQRFQIGTANTLGINTTGTVFVVTSNADVGIGTTNPTSKLHVIGDVRVTGVITASSFSGTATSTTNIPNLTGDITSNGTATSIASGVIVNDDINASAGIVDTKLATISTAGKVLNSATTATNANTASAIVARDASGNFSAGTITANLTGTASTASFATTSYNLTDAANITTGTINSARLTGTYNISISGNAATATYATSAGVSTSVSGGTGSLTQLQVTGISTFTNGPVFIGAATSTGTASQPLQVTGGAYVSGNLGIGTTDTSYKLDVIGRVRATNDIDLDSTTGALNLTGRPNYTIGGNYPIVDISHPAGGSLYALYGWQDTGNDRIYQQLSSSTDYFTALSSDSEFIIGLSGGLLDGGAYFPSYSFKIDIDAETSLYYNHSEKLTTTNQGILVTGLTSTTTLNVGTGGTVITTTATGLVGIGTTNPRSKLDVRGAITVGGAVSITAETSSGNNDVIYFNPLNESKVSIGINTTLNWAILSNLPDVAFVADNSIFGTPKIGIANPTSTDPHYQLYAAYSTGIVPYGYVRQDLNTASYAIALNGSNAFSVGDRASLDATKTSNFSAANEAFVVILNGSTSLFHNKSKKFETSGVGVTVYGNLNVGTGGTVITTTDTGLVGIGTTNPGATLNVVPTSTAIAGLFSGTTSSDMVRITQLGTGNALVVEDSTNPDSSPFVVTGIGSVGIGTASPAFTADIAGDARITSTNKMRFGGTAGTTNFYIQYNSSTNSLDFVAG